MTLHVIHFESAVGRASFTWRDGVVLGADDETAIREVLREIAALREHSRIVGSEPLKVVVRDGDTVLVELGAEAAGSDRATKVVIIAAVADTRPASRRQTAAQAERVLRDVGLLIDGDTLADLLSRRPSRLGSVGDRSGRTGTRRSGGRSRHRSTVWFVAAVSGLLLLYLVYRFFQRPPAP